jgi:hypothetical protein
MFAAIFGNFVFAGVLPNRKFLAAVSTHFSGKRLDIREVLAYSFFLQYIASQLSLCLFSFNMSLVRVLFYAHLVFNASLPCFFSNREFFA